jgi:hypothetical protein
MTSTSVTSPYRGDQFLQLRRKYFELMVESKAALIITKWATPGQDRAGLLKLAMKSLLTLVKYSGGHLDTKPGYSTESRSITH